jgi:hypothetical protein
MIQLHWNFPPHLANVLVDASTWKRWTNNDSLPQPRGRQCSGGTTDPALQAD